MSESAKVVLERGRNTGDLPVAPTKVSASLREGGYCSIMPAAGSRAV